MTAATCIAAVRARYVSAVATPNSLLTVYDNGPIADVSDPRARVSIVVDSEQQITMGGSPTFRCVGRMDVDILTPRDLGDEAIVALSQEVVDAFIGQSIESPAVRFTPPPSLLGAVEFEDALAKRTVRVPFIHDYEV